MLKADNLGVPFGTCEWEQGQPEIDFNEVPVHVFLTWGLLITALLWMGPELWPDNWRLLASELAAIPLFLIVMGSSWRAGANISAGWLPTALMTAPVVILLGIAWSGEFAASFSEERGRRRGFKLPGLEPYRKQL